MIKDIIMREMAPQRGRGSLIHSEALEAGDALIAAMLASPCRDTAAD